MYIRSKLNSGISHWLESTTNNCWWINFYIFNLFDRILAVSSHDKRGENKIFNIYNLFDKSKCKSLLILLTVLSTLSLSLKSRPFPTMSISSWKVTRILGVSCPSPRKISLKLFKMESFSGKCYRDLVNWLTRPYRAKCLQFLLKLLISTQQRLIIKLKI